MFQAQGGILVNRNYDFENFNCYLGLLKVWRGFPLSKFALGETKNRYTRLRYFNWKYSILLPVDTDGHNGNLIQKYTNGFKILSKLVIVILLGKWLVLHPHPD